MVLRILGMSALAAALAVSPGPRTLRAATTADAVPAAPRQTATQQYWVLAFDPASHSSLEIDLDQIGSSTGVQLTYWPTVAHTGYSEIYHDVGLPGTAAGYAVRGVSLRHAGSGWVARLESATAHVRLSFSAVRPGATAAHWPIGRTPPPGNVDFVLNWSVPVAAASVIGSISYEGKVVPIRGWRGYIDHTWACTTWATT